jgi:UDP-sugar transporter A1/2/3
VYGVVSALLSAVAAVYTEWVLKKNNDTLYWQNMLLYGFGAVFNFANLVHRCGGMGRAARDARAACATDSPRPGAHA